MDDQDGLLLTLEEQHEEIERVVRGAAAHFTRRYRRGSLLGEYGPDLYQAGWEEALRAAATFTPLAGVPFGAFIRRPVTLAIVRALMREASPIGGGRANSRPSLLVGMERAPVEAVPEIGDGTLQDQEYDLQDLRHRVRRRVMEVCGEMQGEVALEIIGGVSTPSELSPCLDVPVEEIYRLRTKWMYNLRNDPVLRSLWKDTP